MADKRSLWLNECRLRYELKGMFHEPPGFQALSYARSAGEQPPGCDDSDDARDWEAIPSSSLDLIALDETGPKAAIPVKAIEIASGSAQFQVLLDLDIAPDAPLELTDDEPRSAAIELDVASPTLGAKDASPVVTTLDALEDASGHVPKIVFRRVTARNVPVSSASRASDPVDLRLRRTGVSLKMFDPRQGFVSMMQDRPSLWSKVRAAVARAWNGLMMKLRPSES